jgi:Lrp/AsnC family leucine-responsive transcriptional regulator
MSSVKLDRLDIRILNVLQEDASIPLRTLAGIVHASAATCQRRIAALRANRILLKEVALIDRVRVGRPLTIFVSVDLETQNDARLREFEQTISREPDVMACYEVSGEWDFLLVVAATSMEAYHLFTRRLFTATNNIGNFMSLFAMNCSKFETKIPLEEK